MENNMEVPPKLKIQLMCVCVHMHTQSCLTLCGPVDYSLSLSPVRGIF